MESVGKLDTRVVVAPLNSKEDFLLCGYVE